MRYLVGSPGRVTPVHITCIKVDCQGIHFAFSSPGYTEIFEMIRLAKWLHEQRMVATVDEAIIVLLMEAAKAANTNNFWIHVD